MHASSPFALLSAYAWRKRLGYFSSDSLAPLMSLPSKRVLGDEDITIFLMPNFLHALTTLSVPS